jgi:sporadic carbohydrate cluster protein (TIGR04323 family)
VETNIGYIFSRNIDGGIVSHRVQNIIIKDYGEKNNYQISLSATELNLENAYNVLFDNLNSKRNVFFYSLGMFPKENKLRQDVYQLIRKFDLTIHFCAECLILNKENIEDFDKTLKIKFMTEESIAYQLNSI